MTVTVTVTAAACRELRRFVGTIVNAKGVTQSRQPFVMYNFYAFNAFTLHLHETSRVDASRLFTLEY